MMAAWTVLFTLLLVLLPQSQHITLAAVCPVLAVVFLFAAVHVPYSLSLPSQACEAHLPQLPDLSSRFQRPPPTSL